MTKPTRKDSKNNTGLTGYLMLFLVFSVISLVFACFDIITNRNFYLLMISVTDTAVRISTGAYVGLTVLYIILVSAVIFCFLKRNHVFLKIYVASVVFGVTASVIRLAFFPAAAGVWGATVSVLGIAFNIILLVFWLRYFKTAFEAKVYLKTAAARKDKYERRREKFKVIKKD